MTFPEPVQRDENGQRHVAILWVTAEAVFAAIMGLKSGRLLLPVFRDMPDDARPLGAHYDFERHAFGLMIESPSLPAVLDGCPAPYLDATVTGFREFAAEEPHVVG